MKNNTKIKYLKIENQIYKITNISFFYMEIEASETDLTINDVCKDEIWNLKEFRNYRLKLTNGSGKAEIVDFSDWVNRCK